MAGWHPHRRTSLLVLIRYLVISTSLVEPQSTVNGPVSTGSECCGEQLIDSSARRVVIEASRQLSAGVYRALRLRVCTTDPVSVQLWRRIDDATYEFRWQQTFSPTQSQTTRAYVTISLATSVDVSASDRIGVYSSAMNQLTIPFNFNQLSNVYYSSSLIDRNSSFTVGQRITLDSLRWPRSFSQYIQFCSTADCLDLVSDVSGGSTSNQCCQAESAMSCDPGSTVTDGLVSQAEQVKQLQDNMNHLNKVLDNLVSQKFVTGLCPQGFLSGSYGVGSCYLLFQTPASMAEAVLVCRSYSAMLLTIESSAEEQFIQSFVQNNAQPGQSSMTKLWTTGMYEGNSWTWYSGMTNRVTVPLSSSSPNTFMYTKWLNGTTPVPTGSDDICMTLAIDRQQNTDYWINDFCSRKYYFICEISKRCL